MNEAFKTLSSIDCSKHVEKKGMFSYLSWPWAVKMLRETDPTATWEVVRFNGLPFLQTDTGYFVEVAVTVQGVTLSQIHPVLNNNNQPIKEPNSFQINTSIARCLVKAIALHGLGLYIYAGEDLPNQEEKDGADKDEDLELALQLSLIQTDEGVRKFYKSLTPAQQDRMKASCARRSKECKEAVAA